MSQAFCNAVDPVRGVFRHVDAMDLVEVKRA